MTFDDLILHSKSRAQLSNYLNYPTHALLLTGKVGVGLKTIAGALAREIAGSNVAIIEPTLHDRQKTANINVDDIRSLHETTRAMRRDNLAIIIDDIDKMTNDAPQTFLKLLEEPTPGVMYILTTHSMAKLPATIRSRTQIVEILPPPRNLTNAVIASAAKQSSDTGSPRRFAPRDDDALGAKRAQIDFLGNQCPAEIVRLLNDEEYFRAAATSMEIAKKFVQGDVEQRLQITTKITTRESAIELMENIARLLMLTIAKSKNPKNAAENLTTIATTIDNLAQNGNVRAQLTNLALNIS